MVYNVSELEQLHINLSAEIDDGNDSSVTEVNPETGAPEREAEITAELTEADRKERKKPRAIRRLAKEAKDKALKRAKEREAKEQREKEKRYDLNISSTPNNNVLTYRKALLEAVTVHVVSSDLSSSEDDGAEQLSNKLSNLRAIALVEDETRRYGTSNLDFAPNNTLPLRQEKAKAKKRKRRHPRYDHLFGEYTFTKQPTRGYITNNPMYRRRYSYRISTTSSINKYLQRYNKPFLQPVSTSWRAKGDPAGESCSVLACTSRGESCNAQLPPRTRTQGGRSPPTGAAPTGAATSPTTGAGVGEADAGETTNSSLLLPTAKQDQHRELCAVATSNFNRKQETFGITMNHAPTGSPNRQILVAAGSGRPSTTEWNMCNPKEFNELYNPEPKIPKTYPNPGDQGGTHSARERNLPPTYKNPQNKSKKIIIKTNKNSNKNPIKPLENLTQTSMQTI